MLKSLKMALKGIISDAVSQAPNIKNKSVYIGDGRVLTKNAYGQKNDTPILRHLAYTAYLDGWLLGKMDYECIYRSYQARNDGT